MKEMINKYLMRLFHPFKVFDKGDELSLFEVVVISWAFVFFQAIYQVMKIRIGLSTVHEFDLSVHAKSFFSSRIELYFIVLSSIFAPLLFWAYIKMWSLFIKLFVSLLDRNIDRDECESVATSALVSKFFLIIPVVGPLVANIAYLFYLYAGLRSRLMFSRLQAGVLLFSPPILIAAFVLLEILLLIPPIFYFIVGS